MRIAVRMLICSAMLSMGHAGAAEPASPPPKVTEKSATTVALTDEEKAYIAQGYRLKTTGGTKYFCRSETPLGTRFSSTVCRTAESLRSSAQNSKDAAGLAQQKASQSGNPAGH